MGRLMIQELLRDTVVCSLSWGLAVVCPAPAACLLPLHDTLAAPALNEPQPHELSHEVPLAA